MGKKVLRIRPGHRIIERVKNIQASLLLNAAPSKDGTPYPGTPQAEKGVTHGIKPLAAGSLVSRPGDWSGFAMEYAFRIALRVVLIQPFQGRGFQGAITPGRPRRPTRG